ncbi:MAG: CIA30 family protein [Cyanobacteria bacterium P01_H01_bin.58]
MATDNWNPFRFLETLNYFGEVPFVGNFRWVQQMLGAVSNPQAPDKAVMTPETAVLLQAKDDAIARQLQPLLSQLAIPNRLTLTPAAFPLSDSSQTVRISNAKAIVWVGAPEDETSLQAKIEALKTAAASEAFPLFEFYVEHTEHLKDVWGAVDDVVMGGVSASSLSLQTGFARFAGTVSTANSGGFASVRSRNFEPAFDLSDWQGVRLILRGDGQRYKVILRNSGNWDSLAYCLSVDTEADQWLGIDIPFAAMRATFRARTQSTAPPLDPRSVCSFQLMLSKFEYDGAENPHFRPGTFALDLHTINTYRTVTLPTFLAIATSPEQATAYTTLLEQSTLAHQVLDSSEPQFSDRLANILRF